MSGPTLVVLAAGRARRYGGCKPLAPVGPAGEAVIDLVASDALTAGFTTIVLVIGPSTGPALRYHVEHRWPAAVDVRFALQEAPLGTAHAVLSAAGQLVPGTSVGVGNADDLYGIEALTLLSGHLSAGAPDSALIGYRLRNVIVGDAPVTRGICTVDDHGSLVSIDERRQVLTGGGGRFLSKDGREPSELSGDALVSMNLWALDPAMWGVMEDAVRRAGGASAQSEVLLPEVVAEQLAGGTAPGPSVRVRLIPTESRCVGVTHPDDLALVQADVGRQIGGGARPAVLWSAIE